MMLIFPTVPVCHLSQDNFSERATVSDKGKFEVARISKGLEAC